MLAIEIDSSSAKCQKCQTVDPRDRCVRRACGCGLRMRPRERERERERSVSRRCRIANVSCNKAARYTCTSLNNASLVLSIHVAIRTWTFVVVSRALPPGWMRFSFYSRSSRLALISMR